VIQGTWWKGDKAKARQKAQRQRLADDLGDFHGDDRIRADICARRGRYAALRPIESSGARAKRRLIVLGPFRSACPVSDARGG